LGFLSCSKEAKNLLKWPAVGIILREARLFLTLKQAAMKFWEIFKIIKQLKPKEREELLIYGLERLEQQQPENSGGAANAPKDQAPPAQKPK
jgi:hypothetical protein